MQIWLCNILLYRSQWPRGLRRRSAAACLLRSWVRIPPGAWIFVCCECCLLSGRGLWDELISRPEESYRMWCVVVCDLENLKKEEALTRIGSRRHKKKESTGQVYVYIHIYRHCSGKRNKIRTAANAACQRNFFRVSFWARVPYVRQPRPTPSRL